MDRTLKSTSLKPQQGQSVFLFPGSSEIEPWELWFADGKTKSKCVRTCVLPKDNPWPKRSTLVLPVSHVLCLPLWLNETEPERFQGMIELQLESRGLAGRAENSTVYQWEIAAREENRTLVLVGILPPKLPIALQVPSYGTFDVSVRYYPWPENALILWQEQGKLAVAFTRGQNVVYFQTLSEEHCSDRLLQTLTCLRASLEMQRVVTNLAEIVAWVDLTPQELAALGKALALPARQTERPSPAAPARAWNLCPQEVNRSKQEQEARRWKGRALIAALTIYLLSAAFFLGQFFFTSWQLNGVRKWQAEHGAELDSIHMAQADWQRLTPVVDTNNYPLEILLYCTNAIPKDQLHLTLFEMENGKVEIKGEATNVAAAYVFFDHLKAEPHLAAYTWKMGEPNLLPNDLAQLQIEGSHATTNP